MSGGRYLSSVNRFVKPLSPKCLRSAFTLRGSTKPQGSSTKQIKFICGHETFFGTGKVGEHILDVVVKNNIPLEGFGACEGMRACSTCHVILEKEHFDRVDRINPCSQDELDLLDNAPGLTEYSRLGCQA
ncbi:Adrenodoxinlike ferredoxin 2, partial [Trichostrongylus colubriformis]